MQPDRAVTRPAIHSTGPALLTFVAFLSLLPSEIKSQEGERLIEPMVPEVRALSLCVPKTRK